jgi:hypothetical protein
MMSGLSTTMYAIVKNVTSPPRISRATVEPRSLIRNHCSSVESDRVTSGAVVAFASLSGSLSGSICRTTAAGGRRETPAW